MGNLIKTEELQVYIVEKYVLNRDSSKFSLVIAFTEFNISVTLAVVTILIRDVIFNTLAV